MTFHTITLIFFAIAAILIEICESDLCHQQFLLSALYFVLTESKGASIRFTKIDGIRAFS